MATLPPTATTTPDVPTAWLLAWARALDPLACAPHPLRAKLEAYVQAREAKRPALVAFAQGAWNSVKENARKVLPSSVRVGGPNPSLVPTLDEIVDDWRLTADDLVSDACAASLEEVVSAGLLTLATLDVFVARTHLTMGHLLPPVATRPVGLVGRWTPRALLQFVFHDDGPAFWTWLKSGPWQWKTAVYGRDFVGRCSFDDLLAVQRPLGPLIAKSSTVRLHLAPHLKAVFSTASPELWHKKHGLRAAQFACAEWRSPAGGALKTAQEVADACGWKVEDVKKTFF